MKKTTFIGIVILLVCMIVCLVGYNTLVIQEESQKYQKLQTEAKEPEKETEKKDNTKETSNTPTIYCIGDSLTIGSSSSSYPTALSSLTGFSVNKFGGATDKTIDLSIKMGRTEIFTKDITIPASVEEVPITIYNSKGEELDVLTGELGNFKNVEISGVSGTLNYNSTSQKHTFTRNERGDKVKISSLTQIKASLPEFEDDSIAIIFTGTYDPNVNNGIFRTITYQRAIINQLGTEKYIVVSLTSKRKFSIVRDMNSVLKEEHGDHFLDFRAYLLEHSLEDAGITPTDQDKQDLEKGYIPSSLLKDDVNGNSKFNELLAKQLIEKMIELDYISEDQIQN